MIGQISNAEQLVLDLVWIPCYTCCMKSCTGRDIRNHRSLSVEATLEPSVTDVQLWSQILEGSPSAWEKLVRRYQSLIYTVATSIGLSAVESADCFQQTWYLLFKNKNKLKDPSRISAWLVTTAKREALKLKRHAGSDPGDNISEQPDSSPLPDDLLTLHERQSHLENALPQMDKRCQKLLDAFFFAPEEQSYEQIAKSLNIAVNSLGPIKRRCLDRLKKILVENGFEGVRDL